MEINRKTNLSLISSSSVKKYKGKKKALFELKIVLGKLNRQLRVSEYYTNI